MRFPPNHRHVWAAGLLALSLTGAPLAFGVTVPKTGEAGFVYCLDGDGAKVFAGKTTPDGGLKFGVSVWSPSGHDISVFGIAAKARHGWRYTEDLGAPTPVERCRLDIVRGAEGTLRVTSDPDATCQAHGGVNTEIGTLRFPRAAYEGAVTTELDSPEAFQKVGKCVEAKR